MIPNYTTPESQKCLGSPEGACDRTRDNYPRGWTAGRCGRCYKRQRQADHLAAGISCSTAGCGKAVDSRGMCITHAKAALARGELERVQVQRERGMTFDEVMDEFSEYVPFSTCRYWTGPVNIKGYGLTSLPGTHEKRAHRAVWERHHGPIPAGMHVLHSCHGGHLGCVELSHLYLGDNAQNMRDMAAAGTQKGEKHHNARLNDAKVAAIRALADSGFRQHEIAGILGVVRVTVSDIQRGRRWSHVTEPAPPLLVAAIRGLVELERAPEAFPIWEGAHE